VELACRQAVGVDDVSESLREIRLRDRVVIGRPLVDLMSEGEQGRPSTPSFIHVPSGVSHMASILRDHVLETLHASTTAGSLQGRDAHDGKGRPVLLVEHGSPLKAVNDVRRALAARLQDLLDLTPGGQGTSVVGCAMERRPGSQYDFCEPMITDELAKVAASSSTTGAVVALQFLLPGKHAGVGGDIARIVRSATGGHNHSITRLICEHDAILDLLASRTAEAAGIDSPDA